MQKVKIIFHITANKLFSLIIYWKATGKVQLTHINFKIIRSK